MSGPDDDGLGAAPASAMSVDDAWGLKDQDVPAWAHNRDNILEDVKTKLQRHGSPLKYLATKYPTAADQEQYARVLWHMLPPMCSNPPFLDAEVPGNTVESVSAKDVHIVHLATLSSFGDVYGVPAHHRQVLEARR